MGQTGFFDIARRYAGLDAKNDPLVKIDEVVPWEDFRLRLEAAWRKPAAEWRDHEWSADLPDGVVIVYCVHGREVSQGAAGALRSAGIDAVVLEVGIEGFIQAGGETVAK